MSKKEEEEDNRELSITLGAIASTLDVKHLMESGAIPEALNTPEKIMTVIQTGKELGLAPMTSINNIYVIKGRTVISATMLGALLKKNGKEFTYTKDFVSETVGDNTRQITEMEFEWLSPITGHAKSTKFSVSWQEMELAGYTTNKSWAKYPKCLGPNIAIY